MYHGCELKPGGDQPAFVVVGLTPCALGAGIPVPVAAPRSRKSISPSRASHDKGARIDRAEPLVVVPSPVWARCCRELYPFGSGRRKIGFPPSKGCTPSRAGAGWRSNFDARRKFFAGCAAQLRPFGILTARTTCPPSYCDGIEYLQQIIADQRAAGRAPPEFKSAE
jgi:hypothetical protein